MEIENLKKEIETQTLEIKNLRRDKKRLNRKIVKLEQDLYFENKTRANNHKTMLRVKDIVDMYSVGKSTIWAYAKEKITPIKISDRVTVFDAKEVKEFFKSMNKETNNITPNIDAKVLKERQKQLENSPKALIILNSKKIST